MFCASKQNWIRREENRRAHCVCAQSDGSQRLHCINIIVSYMEWLATANGATKCMFHARPIYLFIHLKRTPSLGVRLGARIFFFFAHLRTWFGIKLHTWISVWTANQFCASIERIESIITISIFSICVCIGSDSSKLRYVLLHILVFFSIFSVLIESWFWARRSNFHWICWIYIGSRIESNEKKKKQNVNLCDHAD